VRHALRRTRDPVGELGIGAGQGIGSLVYALTRCAGWLGEPGLLADAALGAERLAPSALAGPASLGIHGGLAGACLGLLVLHSAQPDGRWLEAATAWGDLILGRRPGPEGPRLPGGFAHGAAGVAYALARLARASGLPRFRAGAEEAVAWGQARTPGPAAVPLPGPRPSGWCSGAPGIGLGRAGALDVLDNPRVRREVEAAMAEVQDPVRLPYAHLCCGAMGLAEVAFTLGRDLGRPEWVRLGRDRAWALLLSHHGQGALRWYPREDLFSPGLFVGSAGLGYQALRLACPERVPCVLRFE
jgi:lantibiotic modifying enzyme